MFIQAAKMGVLGDLNK